MASAGAAGTGSLREGLEVPEMEIGN